MQYLNQQIAAMAKKKSVNLVRPQVSCGIFQELPKQEVRKTKAEEKD